LRRLIINKLLPVQQIGGKPQSDVIDAEIITEDKHIR